MPVRTLLAICATSGLVAFPRAEAYEALSRDIPALPLAQALGEFADQTGLQVVYVSGIAVTRVSGRVARGLPATDALQRMLARTGLHFEFLNDRTVRIFAGPGCVRQSGCVDAAVTTAALQAPPESLEEVVIIRPRWQLNPTDAMAPVTVLDRRDIERGGESSIGDVLQSLPMSTGSPLNTSVNAPGSAEPRGRGVAGDGSVRMFLHDLPTVVLLNGRRLPGSGLGADASVDLNTLPMSLIERVEVLAGGASAEYGANAVGGVVNVVTRRADRGLVLGGTRMISERGDGEVVTGQATVGFDLFGGTWSIGVDYVRQDGVTMDRRSYSAVPLVIADRDETLSREALNDMAANGYIDVADENALGLEVGFYTVVPGATGESAADYRQYVNLSDGFNPASFNYAQTPNQRAALWLMGSRPLSENVDFFLEALVHHRESAQQAAPAFYRTGFALPTDGGHPVDNYYNPFGIDIPVIWRRLVEAGNRRNEQEVDLWRILVGLEGSVARWSWELALQGAVSDTSAVETGFYARPRMITALGPSGLDAAGRVVCGSPDPATGRVPPGDIIPGCVPLNLFGGAGSITEEQLAYVFPGTMINRGTNDQRYAQFVLTGPGGRMQGGDVQWTLGADYRREAGSSKPDPLHANYVNERFQLTQDLFRYTPEVNAANDSYELYSVVQVPLLHDRRWARDMAMNIGLRWSDDSSFEGHTTWQAGLRWQPADELTLRTSYGEVYRAPSLVELYEQPVQREEFHFDPCGNDPTPAQRANCAADGVPGGAYVQDGWGLMADYGGNPELEPETGHTLGAGLIYTPAWAQGLSASVDYFQANLSGLISFATPDQILFECAERGRLCEATGRTADGNVTHLLTGHNFGELEVRAVDIAVNWSAMTRIGALNSRLLASYLDRWDRQLLSDGEVQAYAGNFDAGARPRWRASGHLDWHSGPWMASYAAEYIGSYSERVEPWPIRGIEFEPFDRRVDPVVYHDIEAGFEFGPGVTLRAAITNATDEDPPYLNIAPGNTDVATYRLLGRSYFLDLRYRFE
jgi:outer membrane receptor protein involved in Fe transport